MDLFLDFGFAWISVILVILLTIIFILRKLINKNENLKAQLKGGNRFLRKHHKKLGIALILTAFIHGLSSSVDVFSLNLGTTCWVLSILLGLNYMFRKSFQKFKGWMFYHRILTVTFLLVLILHIYNVGIQAPSLLMDALSGSESGNKEYSYSADNAGTSDSNSSGSTESPSNAASVTGSSNQMQGLELKDGTYEGQADGYGGALTVSVVIKNNSIVSIDIVKHNERNSNIYRRAMDTVPKEIIDNQSLNVDTVSGATFTSVGIINAVKNALSNALISGTLPTDLTPPERRGMSR